MGIKLEHWIIGILIYLTFLSTFFQGEGGTAIEM